MSVRFAEGPTLQVYEPGESNQARQGEAPTIPGEQSGGPILPQPWRVPPLRRREEAQTEAAIPREGKADLPCNVFEVLHVR